MEHFSIGIEQAAVSSLIKHGIEKMEDRGEILNGTDLNVRLALGNSLDVDVEFDSEPVLMVTKQAYEQILKSLDNIALPNDNSNETKIESEESIVEKKEFKAIRAALHLHGLTIDMRDESNKPTVKVIFSDFKLDFDKQTEDCFTTNLILGGLEAIDSLESPESHMLRSRKPERRLRKSSSWPRCLNNPKEYIRHKRLSSYGVSMPQKSSQALSSPVGLMRTHSFISRTRPKLKSHQKPENDASLVKIFIKQKNPPNRTGEREIKIKFSELEAGVNLQTWVMLLDFLTPSSASLQVIIYLLHCKECYYSKVAFILTDVISCSFPSKTIIDTSRRFLHRDLRLLYGPKFKKFQHFCLQNIFPIFIMRLRVARIGGNILEAKMSQKCRT